MDGKISKLCMRKQTPKWYISAKMKNLGIGGGSYFFLLPFQECRWFSFVFFPILWPVAAPIEILHGRTRHSLSQKYLGAEPGIPAKMMVAFPVSIITSR